MSRRRLHAAEFVKLLESVAQPLYVLDDSLAIVFMNEACRAWLGDSAGELVGQSCSISQRRRQVTRRGHRCPPLPSADCLGRPRTYGGGHSARRLTKRCFERRASCRSAVPMDRCSASSRWWIPTIRRNQSLTPTRSLTNHRRFTCSCCGSASRNACGCRRQAWPASRPPRGGPRSQAEIAAAARANVLLLGPPGGGHRRLAEAIHYGGQGHMGDSLLVPSNAACWTPT